MAVAGKLALYRRLPYFAHAGGTPASVLHSNGSEHKRFCEAKKKNTTERSDGVENICMFFFFFLRRSFLFF